MRPPAAWLDAGAAGLTGQEAAALAALEPAAASPAAGLQALLGRLAAGPALAFEQDPHMHPQVQTSPPPIWTTNTHTYVTYAQHHTHTHTHAHARTLMHLHEHEQRTPSAHSGGSTLALTPQRPSRVCQAIDRQELEEAPARTTAGRGMGCALDAAGPAAAALLRALAARYLLTARRRRGRDGVLTVRGAPQHGRYSDTMALITSGCGAMRSASIKWP